MAAYEQIKKVKLKDPITVGDSAAILYPVTGLNAIFAGTSGDAATTYITGTGSGTQIQPQYLAIISNGTVGNQYLAFMDTTDGKIKDNYLKFITGTGKISQDYLPSYVDDVVDVPVVQAPDFADSTVYSLMIQEGTNGSVKTYTFYQWNGSQWVQGGGEQSKIYVAVTEDGAGDGSIYRCKSGSTTQAIKISENPYVISTDKTNGVWLDLSNNTLTAKAQVATAAQIGTVQIDNSPISPTKNAALTINGGTLGLTVVLAGSTQAGAVFAVGTQADYAARSSAYGDASIVPTAKWTQDLIDSALTGVPLATYETPGIVQPSQAGHILVSSGVISVPDATVSTAGVVYLVDTINTATTGNAGKAVTQAGIVSYVGSVVSDYQPKLISGNGIAIASNGTISVDKTGDALGFNTSGQLFVSSATATTMGAVLITGDSSVIANSTAYIDGKPLAVNGAAVKDYVDYQFAHYTPTYAKATLNGSGVVQIRPLASATSTDSSYLVPNAWDVANTIAGATAAVLYKIAHGLIVAGGGIELTSNTEVTPNTLQVGVKLDTTSTSPLYLIDGTSRLAISAATSNSLGVMQAGTGLAVTGGGTVYVPMVDEAAGFDVTSNASKAATVSAIVDYVEAAVAQGQRPITAGIGITITSGASSDEVAVNYTGAIIASGSAITVRDANANSAGVVTLISDLGYATPSVLNQAAHAYAVKTYLEGAIATLTAHSDPIYVVSASDPNSAGSLQIKNAADGQRGVVTLADDKSNFGASAYSSAVPTASALVDYVATTLGNYQTTLHSGAAIQLVNGSTVDVLYATNQMSLDANNKLVISSATNSVPGLVSVPASSGLVITDGAVTAAIAGATVLGAVKIGTGVTVAPDGTISVDTGVNDSASYVSGSAATDVPLGGVRVVSSAGILLNVGNIYLDSATTGHLGGIKLAATDTALAMKADGETLAVQIDTNVMSMTNNNKLTVKHATSSTDGAVQILDDASLMENGTYANKTPVASAVANYVAAQIAGGTVTLAEGYGIDISSSTTGKQTNYTVAASVAAPIIFNGGAIAIQTASATATGELGGAALGAVNIYGLGIRSDFTELTATKASTVPTESAVRTAINALPYITYEEVN